jgi:uncharacterized protein (DUF305 family)
METKPLLYGIIGFMLGGLLVSVAATTFDKPSSDVAMDDMVTELQDKKGDAYDEAFISGMIMHHEAAVDMAKLSESRAQHPEIKELSKNIIQAQEQEINDMKQWQSQWGYQDNEQSSH